MPETSRSRQLLRTLLCVGVVVAVFALHFRFVLVNFSVGATPLDTGWFAWLFAEGNPWLINPLSFFFVATIIIVWGAIPFVAFTVYAGLTQVPDEVMEAAQLDGAGGVKRFLLVVVPYIRSILIIVTILQVIWDLRVFTQIYSLQSIGGLAEQTNTLGVYIYQVSIAGGDFGAGGAIAVITAIILMSVSLYYIRQVVKEEEL